jgi:glycosyltransferase involved in cell wall biosynthesis
MTQQERRARFRADADILPLRRVAGAVAAKLPPPLRRVAGAVAATLPPVSVVIPTCNEARNLPRLFSRLPSDLHEVIVVDGRSVDETVEVAESLRPDVHIVLQNRTGRGNALACGFQRATGDVLVALDPDGSADPRDIPLLVAMLSGGADYVRGSWPAGYVAHGAPGSWATPWLHRTVEHLRCGRAADDRSGCTAFWARHLPWLGLDPSLERAAGDWGDGFEIDAIIRDRMEKLSMRIAEVTIHH